jgi:multidrug efflux pump subunit AcrA (membrane-fusion protein)
MTAVFSASATVASGNQGIFDILDGTKVTKVNVRVGDLVKKGDILAEFDASSLNGMLAQKRKDFESASTSYANYLKTVADAPKQAAALKKRIATLEKNIAAMQKNTAAATAQTPATTEEKQLAELKAGLSSLLGDNVLANFFVNSLFSATGSISKTISAVQQLLSGSFLTGSGNLQSMLGSINSLTNPELMSSSLELVQLKVQESMLGLQSGTSLENVYKALSDSSAAAYKQAEETVKYLRSGWKAEYDGIIRDVNVEEGEVYHAPANSAAASTINVTSLLASLSAGQADIGTLLGGLFSNTISGMTVEYYPFTASFLLGKYDIAKVSLDQPVTVTSVSGEDFDAYVSYISPVAQEGSEINISSLIGSGGGSAKGVEARITIPQPDASITIGLDVDVAIDLETRTGVVQAPAQSILFDEDEKKSYVFLFNSAENTILKQYITMGLFDGTNYEVTEGLTSGENIVRAPQRSWLDGQKVKIAG